ncbi:MAG TPA: gephyrin-like molybdotransferase Glp [Pyrinomonadaceae bacterium]|nr:gephyrin-like molybdotransferase Glp [Pyrinomonadaceae bacterium]
MIPVSEAIQIVKQKSVALSAESVSLEDSLGRYLAQDIFADCDLPPFDRSQMDGYAIRAADVLNASADTPVPLQIVGESAAGRGWHHEMSSGQAVRIMTGAPVPAGADSVQQVELTRETENKVNILEPVAVGRSIVKQAAEIRSGALVLHAGEQVNAGMVAVLASFGYARVSVGLLPRVAVLATGSELVAVDQKPGMDQIRDSNNYSISSYAKLAGAIVERLPLAGDDADLLQRQISEAAERSDIVITSGGVSVGVYDFTKLALKQLGAEFFFEKVALRPGKPTVFAKLPNGALVFGLPGNPVSVSVTFNLFARAAILAAQKAGQTELEQQTAVLSAGVKSAKERESYLPARLRTNDEGHLRAEPLKWGGSSDFIGFARANSLVVVPADAGVVEAGAKVRILLLP